MASDLSLSALGSCAFPELYYNNASIHVLAWSLLAPRSGKVRMKISINTEVERTVSLDSDPSEQERHWKELPTTTLSAEDINVALEVVMSALEKLGEVAGWIEVVRIQFQQRRACSQWTGISVKLVLVFPTSKDKIDWWGAIQISRERLHNKADGISLLVTETCNGVRRYLSEAVPGLRKVTSALRQVKGDRSRR